jgi:hypothetical protein
MPTFGLIRNPTRVYGHDHVEGHTGGVAGPDSDRRRFKRRRCPGRKTASCRSTLSCRCYAAFNGAKGAKGIKGKSPKGPFSGRAAVEWLRINPVTNTIIQSGVISDPSLSFVVPSIAVNEFHQVLIGFSGSSDSTFGSSYYAFGETSGNITSFTPVSQAKAGSAQYEVLDGSSRNRWGDYSATVVDPVNPYDFWTFQLFAPSTNNWQVQVTQLHAPVSPVPEPAAAASLILTTTAGFLTVSRRRRRA